MSKFTCCVEDCNSSSKKDQNTSFHRFPADPELRFKWLIKVRKGDFKVTPNTRVCSKHFRDEDFKPFLDNLGRRSLKWSAVPTQFSWHKNPGRRKIIRQTTLENGQVKDEDSEDCGGPLEKRKVDNHSTLEQRIKAAELEIQELKSQIESLKIYKFGVERFKTDDESIKFYTGFPSYNHFITVFEMIQPSAENMVYCYASGMSNSRSGSRKMLLIDEYFMFLVRVRVGLLQQVLADIFNIHISTVSRKIVTWANYLYFFLGSQPIWPTLDAVKHHSPQGFKELFPTTRVIIDCTEVKVQVPSSLLLQSQMYSTYKSCTTLKSLIGITPNGAICFVSNLYTGSISDKEITKCCGILDLLEANESIMADKGFNIDDLLQCKSVELNIPPYLANNQQFTPNQVRETKAIASLRIHVERAIRRIKEFHIFSSVIPLSLLGTINQIWTVCCLLTNFQGPLIKRNNSRG